jgi:hypothetical protein
MANVDNPHGLTPIEHINGNPWNGATRRCRVDDTAGDLFVGDAVVWNGAGSGGYPEVIGATVGDGNKIFGVIVSFEPQPASSLETLYIASADSGWANVCVDPDVVYMIQANGVVGSADIGQNAVLVADHSGDTTTGISGTEMNATTAANASYQLTIIGGVDRPDNDLTLTHAEWKVIINLHSLRAVDANAGGTAEGAAGV